MPTVPSEGVWDEPDSEATMIERGVKGLQFGVPCFRVVVRVQGSEWNFEGQKTVRLTPDTQKSRTFHSQAGAHT